MSRQNLSHPPFLSCFTTSKRQMFSVPVDNVYLLRFVFEKTFATCLTLDHLQGALTADNVYMELLQVHKYYYFSHPHFSLRRPPTTTKPSSLPSRPRPGNFCFRILSWGVPTVLAWMWTCWWSPPRTSQGSYRPRSRPPPGQTSTRRDTRRWTGVRTPPTWCPSPRLLSTSTRTWGPGASPGTGRRRRCSPGGRWEAGWWLGVLGVVKTCYLFGEYQGNQAAGGESGRSYEGEPGNLHYVLTIQSHSLSQWLENFSLTMSW